MIEDELNDIMGDNTLTSSTRPKMLIHKTKDSVEGFSDRIESIHEWKNHQNFELENIFNIRTFKTLS